MDAKQTAESITKLIELLETDETERVSYDEMVAALKSARKIARQMYLADTYLGKGWLRGILKDVLDDMETAEGKGKHGNRL